MPFGHTSPAPFGGTLPKGEGLGVVVLNNHLAVCVVRQTFPMTEWGFWVVMGKITKNLIVNFLFLG